MLHRTDRDRDNRQSMRGRVRRGTSQRSSFGAIVLPSDTARLASRGRPESLAAWRSGGIVFVYALLRVVLVPHNADLSVGFSHDSAYIATAARNVIAGRGLVNDAHWLVFLQPRRLPMPFHNANPLYPLSIAGLAAISGTSVARAGLFVSALASVVLVSAVIFLINGFVQDWRHRLTVAFAVAMFPPLFESSLAILPDMLCLALSVASTAAFVRSNSWVGFSLAGVLFGLAWLARSSAVLLIPAILVYAVLALGWRRGLMSCLVAGAAAAVVASPWLWFTAKQWGSPLRSDAYYYLIQDYEARTIGSGVVPETLVRYWHSPNPPPPFSSILAHEPLTLTLWLLRGIPRVILSVGAAWTWASPAVAVASAILLLFLLTTRWRVLLKTPALIALAVYSLTLLLVLGLRPFSVEIRYGSLLTASYATVLVLTTMDACRRCVDKRGTIWAAAALGSGLFLWLLAVPAQDYSRWITLTGPSAVRLTTRALDLWARRFAGPGPVVVGDYPYFFSYDTGGRALSIPEADDQYLIAYMRRYGAQHVLLTDQESAFWRPQWTRPNGVPAAFRVVARHDHASLYELQAP